MVFAGFALGMLSSSSMPEKPAHEDISIEDLEAAEINIDLSKLVGKKNFTASDLSAALGEPVSLIMSADLFFLAEHLTKEPPSGTDEEKKQQVLDTLHTYFPDTNLDAYIENSGDINEVLQDIKDINSFTQSSLYGTNSFAAMDYNGNNGDLEAAYESAHGGLIVFDEHLFFFPETFILTAFGVDNVNFSNTPLAEKVDMDLIRKAILVHETEHLTQGSTVGRMFKNMQSKETFKKSNLITQSIEIDSDNSALTYLNLEGANTETISFYQNWRILSSALESLKYGGHEKYGFMTHSTHHLHDHSLKDYGQVNASYEGFLHMLSHQLSDPENIKIHDVIDAAKKVKQTAGTTTFDNAQAQFIIDAAVFFSLTDTVSGPPTPRKAPKNKRSPT